MAEDDELDMVEVVLRKVCDYVVPKIHGCAWKSIRVSNIRSGRLDGLQEKRKRKCGFKMPFQVATADIILLLSFYVAQYCS